MISPSAVTTQSEINSAISEVVSLLAPDVVHIRYDIGEDWSGDWGIFFRILLSDEAGRTRLRDDPDQFAVGILSMWSITSVSICSLRESSLKPNRSTA